jgi:hypothetical protein
VAQLDQIGVVANGEEPPSGDAIEAKTYPLNAECGAAIAQFEGSALLEEGKLNLIGLDAVVERFAGRWPLRRDQVYELTERTLEQRLDIGDRVMRVSERDYLIIQPTKDRFAAQALCLKCVRELIQHFLGRVQDADLRICEVRRVTGHGIEASPLDPRALQMAASEPRSWGGEGEPSGPPPFVAADGRTVRVECALEPVFRLTNRASIGYRLARRVVAVPSGLPLGGVELQRLSRGDLERIDLATVAAGLERLEVEAPGERPQSLVIPASFINLNNFGGRALIMKAFDDARLRVDKGIICEIVDLDGAPLPAVVETVSLIRPHCLLVGAHVADAEAAPLRNLRNAGFDAASVVCPPSMESDAEFIGWARTTIGAAKRIAKPVLVHGLSNPRRAAMAEVLGASHVSGAEVVQEKGKSAPPRESPRPDQGRSTGL